ncbi:LamB/YcsF family protein [Ornithinibacillus salinisoli]|uniref:5-oxoprolinase subunit A n=1 Tax=Ornithinibacillus salinisoli TaxID=1848459 RepID=A0ABW4W3S5_9BACI
MKKFIDLNCDLGESFGAYKIGSDEQIMPTITSANIACGAHAGDPHVMDQAVRLAKKYNVSIGAHPGFPDLAGFGRRMMDFSPEEIYRFVVFQIGSLQAFCNIHHVTLRHVKPHGALYNLASRNRKVADAIAQAVYDLDSNLILFGLAGSELINAGRETGLAVASEVFADRTYQLDGSLTPRSATGALIEDVDIAISQVDRMVSEGTVKTIDGNIIDIEADTVCIHGDGSDPIDFVNKLRDRLGTKGVQIVAFGNEI